MRQSTRPRSGVNVIIVLVIVAAVVFVMLVMFAILLALLVPAVAKVREAAARTQSHNSMRQCAIAIHNYHDTYKRLPNASGLGGLYKNPGQEQTMWFHLLPYVEADNLYQGNVHNAVIGAYLAPSDPYVSTTDGKLNFAANIRLFGYETLGKDVADGAVTPGTGQPSGQSLSGSLAPIMTCGLSLARIKDGTSNTFLLSTRYADCGNQSTFYSASPTGTPLGGGNGNLAGKGGYFGAGSHNQVADRNSTNAIFQVSPPKGDCIAADSVFGHSFSSSGLSVALADATVKVINPNITPTTFCRALCPSDGNGFDNDWND